MALFRYLSNLLFFFYSIIKSAVIEFKSTKLLILRTITQQIYFTGYEALPIVSIVAVAVGAVLLTQSKNLLFQFGIELPIESMMTKIIIREIAPLMLILIIVSRSGAAISTEIGNMKLNREFEALEIMGISLEYFIILPRIIGVMIALFCLAIYFNIIAIVGGFLILNFKIITSTPSIWLNQVISNIVLSDVYLSCSKCALFGLLIALISSFHGLQVKEAFTEVPKVTTHAVVNSIIFCFCINVIVALFLFPIK